MEQDRTHLTIIEIERIRQGLEQAAATTLGRMLFELSRLDMNLGLLLIWTNEGKDFESLKKKVANLTFQKRLELLSRHAEKKYGDNEDPRTLYRGWLEDTHMVREIRNELVHGRWWVDGYKDQVVNVIGLPTSPDQREVRYTIRKLKSLLTTMKALRNRLAMLRETWPL